MKATTAKKPTTAKPAKAAPAKPAVVEEPVVEWENEDEAEADEAEAATDEASDEAETDDGDEELEAGASDYDDDDDEEYDDYKPTRSTPPVGSTILGKRARFIAACKEQIKIRQADIAGVAPDIEKKTYRMSNDGVKSAEVRPIRVSRWWSTAPNGKLYLSPRYGRQFLELGPQKKPSIRIESLDDVIPKLQKFMRRCEAGELDATITTASKKTGRSGRVI